VRDYGRLLVGISHAQCLRGRWCAWRGWAAVCGGVLAGAPPVGMVRPGLRFSPPWDGTGGLYAICPWIYAESWRLSAAAGPTDGVLAGSPANVK